MGTLIRVIRVISNKLVGMGTLLGLGLLGLPGFEEAGGDLLKHTYTKHTATRTQTHT